MFRELESVRLALNTVELVLAWTRTWRQTPPRTLREVELVEPEAVVTEALNW